MAPYLPTFMDGWTPDPSFFADEAKEAAAAEKQARGINVVSAGPSGERYADFYYDSDRGDRRSQSPPSERGFGPRSDISNDSIEKSGIGAGNDPLARFERQQRRWLSELKARNGKIVQVTYPRTANNDKELTVVRGEYLEVSAMPFLS